MPQQTDVVGMSLNDLIRALQQRLWDCEAERFRSPEINHQLKLRGLEYYGKSAGFDPLRMRPT